MQPDQKNINKSAELNSFMGYNWIAEHIKLQKYLLQNLLTTHICIK